MTNAGFSDRYSQTLFYLKGVGIMNGNYVLLTQKEEMWAQMLLQVLEDHQIPCTALPVNGAGYSIRTGTQDSLKVFVPAENLPQARDLLEELFSAEILFEEEAESE